MALWFNYTDSLGTIINYITLNITGSEFLTYTFILIIILAFLFLARVSLELQSIIIFPFVLVLGAYSNNFLIFTGLVSLFSAFIFIQFLITRL